MNVNTFENVDPSRFDRKPMDFEGEEKDARLARRARNWIANVHFE